MITVDLTQDEFEWITGIVSEEIDHTEEYTKKERKSYEPILEGDPQERLEFLDGLMRKLSEAFQRTPDSLLE